MDWAQLAGQGIMVLLKEGLSFVFANLKDRKAAEKAEADLQEASEAQATTAAAKEEPSATQRPDWRKVATLFWLGNDLMWIKDMTYRGAPPERVLEGIDNALHYVEELGFPPNSLASQELKSAKNIAAALVGLSPQDEKFRPLIQGHYETMQGNVQTATWYIHAMAEQRQPGFEKRRAL